MKIRLQIFLVILLINSIYAQKISNSYIFEKLSETQMIIDVNDLYNKIDTVHYNPYHQYSKAQFDSLRTFISSNINKEQNRFEFYETLLPVFNMFSDAHSMLGFPYSYLKSFSSQGGTFLPLKVFIHDNSVYIIEEYEKKGIPPYSRIISVNDIPVETILLKLKSFSNREITDAENDYMAFLFPRVLYPLYGIDKNFTINIETPKKNRKCVTYNGIPYNEFPHKDKPNYEFYRLDKYTGVLDINACEDKLGFPLFIDSVFTLLQKDGTKNLIIDLRDNPGGSTFHGDTLLSYLTNKKVSQYPKRSIKYSPYSTEKSDSVFLATYSENLEHAQDNPKRFNGTIYTLTNINTFSSATILAATLQCYGISKLIGQETGGTQVFFGENTQLELPNSKLKYLLSFEVDYCPCGTEWTRGVIPNYPIPVDLEKKSKGRDPEIEFVKKLTLKNNGK